MCEEVKTKVCIKCQRSLPANTTYFNPDKRLANGLKGRCRECMGLSFKFPVQVKEGYKLCPKCNRELPATKEYFYQDKKSKDCLMTDCKECRGHNFTIRIRNIDTWTEDGYKPCSKCGKLLPANKKYFYQNKEQTDGLFGKCKECMGGEMGRVLRGKEAYNDKGEKKCSSCGNWYPPTNEYFGNKKLRKDGLDCQCKNCVHEYSVKNKEYFKQRNRERYLRDKERIRKVSDEWKKKNPEKVAAIAKRNRGTERFRKAAVKNQQKREARKAQLRATLTIEQWNLCLEYFQNTCAYCGNKEDKLALAQDHVIPLSKGGEYTVNNIIPCCRSCNSKKNNKDLMDWYTPELPFYSELRKKKILKYLKTDGEKQQLALEF